MVSIVITTFNRPLLLLNTLQSFDRQSFKPYEIIVVDDGTDDRTQGICYAWHVKYVRLIRPPSTDYRCPALPVNVGIRRAKGDVILLQNAECQHIDPETIQKLTSAVTETNVVFAKVTALNEDGTLDVLYCGKGNPRPYFFCGAIKRKWFEELRGFDEDFVGYGYEDDDFASRLRVAGVTFEFTDVEVHHQWHPSAGTPDMTQSVKLFNEKTRQMHSGTLGIVRNLNHEWGNKGD